MILEERNLKDIERIAKEDALQKADHERIAKEEANKTIEF